MHLDVGDHTMTTDLLARYAAFHERQPALRPKRPDGYTFKFTSDDSPAWYGSITRDIHLADEWDALNACRCAAEDWLMKRGWLFTGHGGKWLIVHDKHYPRGNMLERDYAILAALATEIDQ